MLEAYRRKWLADLAAHGDRRVTSLFGYDRLPGSWALDFPAGLPEHLIYLLVGGSIEGEIADRPVVLRAGTLLWLPPRTPFRLHATGHTPVRLYRFRLAHPAGGSAIGAAQRNAVDEPRILSDAWELRATCDALVAELGSRLELRAERLRALLVVLFSGIFRLAARGRRTAPLAEEVRTRLEDLVDARPYARPSTAQLAAAAGLSVDYFARRFRATYGMAPRAWLVRRRIHRAMVWLDESEESVSVIAARLGYPDVFLFSRQFTAVAGLSPRHWRTRGNAPRLEP